LASFLGRGGVGRVFLYLLAVQTAVQVSGPYFPPYMLRQLGLSYASYMILLSAAFVAKIAFLPAMGRLVDRWGTTRLLWIGGVGLIPLSSMWIVSDHFGYLLGLQVLSGAAWAAYELAMLLLAFETIPRHQRVGMLTVYNMANATAILVGSLIGGSILALMGEVRHAYWLLFLVSSGARIAAIPVLSGLPRWSMRSLASAIGRAARVRTKPVPSRPSATVLQGPHWHRPLPVQSAPPDFRSDDWESDDMAVAEERR
jgi:MFS family permease